MGWESVKGQSDNWEPVGEIDAIIYHKRVNGKRLSDMADDAELAHYLEWMFDHGVKTWGEALFNRVAFWYDAALVNGMYDQNCDPDLESHPGNPIHYVG